MKKIAVIDDSEAIRRLYREEFIEMGYQVFLSSTGEELLRIIKEEQPDLLILSDRLFNNKPLELLAKTKELQPKTKVIFNAELPGQREAAKSLGANCCLMKSSDLCELKRAVRELCPLEEGKPAP